MQGLERTPLYWLNTLYPCRDCITVGFHKRIPRDSFVLLSNQCCRSSYTTSVTLSSSNPSAVFARPRVRFFTCHQHETFKIPECRTLWSHFAIHFLLKAYLLKPVSADPVFCWARIRDLAEIGILGQLWQPSDTSTSSCGDARSCRAGGIQALVK